MRTLIESAGFSAPADRSLGSERGTMALAELAATAGLIVSIVVAATVVSVGMARAGVADGVIDNEGGLFAIALLLGVIFIGLGGLASLKPTNRHRHRH
jgi:hypothetical protein